MSDLAKAALELAPEQRRTLARIRLELSDENEDFSPEVEAAWDDEIARRLDAVKSGAAAHSSLEDVFVRLDQRFVSWKRERFLGVDRARGSNHLGA